MTGNNLNNKPYRISGVLLDFDGTLTKPDALDFSVIKKIVGCPDEIPALEFIESIPDSQERAEAFSELNRFESLAAANSEPNPGAEDLIRAIHSMDLPLGLITRNSMDSVREALKKFNGISLEDFDIVITRNDAVKPKPSPEGILLAARKLNIDPRHVLMVGDFVFDIDAGRSAGTLTALLDVNPRVDKSRVDCDIVISCLTDLEPILKMGSPLPQGKLPNQLLEEILRLLKTMQRESMFSEFSITKMLAGAFQTIVFFCLLISIWFWMDPTNPPASLHTLIGYALVFQLMVVAFYIMKGR